MLNVLLVVISTALIILCLLQSGKSDGIVNALLSKLKLVCTAKERADLVMTRVTTGLALHFHNFNVINNRAKVLFLFWNREVNE
ncbi:MAG: preprotein translocase subunit SecG [Thomasclavelia ramosa]